MNGYAPPPPPPLPPYANLPPPPGGLPLPNAPPSNGHGPSLSHRPGDDFVGRPSTSLGPGAAPVSVPQPQQGGRGGVGGGMPGNVNMAMAGFPHARSPPSANKSKDLKHVLCKFYKQGQCQAGNGCLYSHTLEKMQPCKYYLKGNCKFGLSCANEHVNRDGTIANRPRFGAPNGMNRQRWPPGAGLNSHGHPQSPSLLSMEQQQQQLRAKSHPTGMQQISNDDLNSAAPPNHGIPTIDMTYSPHHGSIYGSSPADRDRAGLGMSPVTRGLSIHDAQLPASFDSQGVSTLARYGPVAASFPKDFGLNSQSPPLASQFQRGNGALADSIANSHSALHSLRSSAFGEKRTASAQCASGGGFYGSSPPVGSDETDSRRLMHSARLSSAPVRNRFGGSGAISSSLPMGAIGRSIPIPPNPHHALHAQHGRMSDEWERDFEDDEDVGLHQVPKTLYDDILTPDEQEKSARMLSCGPRYSAATADAGAEVGSEWGGSPRPQHSISRIDSSPASANNSVVGSPSSGVWAVKHHQLFEAGAQSARGPSAFGHVGSPLRLSSLQIATGQGLGGQKDRPRLASHGSGRSVESAGAFGVIGGRSPENGSGSAMSMLSHQLQRSSLSGGVAGAGVERSSLGARTVSNEQQQRILSTSSNNSNGLGKGRGRIEEETEDDGLFAMDEIAGKAAGPEFGSSPTAVETPQQAESRKAGSKRLSGGSGLGTSSHGMAD